jgi:Zn-finger protein
MKYKFIQHKECEFFPCHTDIDPEELNCLFCYCPLYPLQDKCGGNPTFLEDGTKDCSLCSVTHKKDSGYAHVMSKIDQVLEISKKK